MTLQLKHLYSLMILIAFIGCNSQPSGPTPEELLLRKRMRESQQAAQGMSTQERIESVQALLDEDNAIAAIEEIKPLLLAEPTNFEVIMLAAKVRASSGDPAGAVETLRAVDATNIENHAEALWTGVPWLIEALDFEGAADDLKKLLELRPNDRKVLQKIVLVMHYLGNSSQAAVYLKQLTRNGQAREHELMAMNNYSLAFVDPAFPRPELGDATNLALLHDARIRLAENRSTQAALLASRLRGTFPDSTPVAAFQGRVFASQENTSRLQAWLAELPEGIEFEPEYWHGLAALCLAIDSKKQAVRCLLETVNRDATNLGAHQQLAELLESLEELDAAKRVKSQADLIEETYELARVFSERVGTNDELKRMASALDKLNRPYEALGWRRVAAALIRGNEARIADIDSQRKSLLSQHEQTPQPSTGESLGFDLEAWPLPDISTLRNTSQ